MTHLDENCLFCKIIQGTIPSQKLFENETCYAFLDIGPISKGHALVIPKYHGESLHDVPDEYLADLLLVAKKVAKAQDVKDYNVLQNNGRIAHQFVGHVHVHMIPKPSMEQGLVIGWPGTSPSKDELQAVGDKIRANIITTDQLDALIKTGASGPS